MNVSQVEYIRRVNKVVDYIEAHMDTELNLAHLAAIASFSPFHFHRVFSVITGETLNNFIKRLRLEKAARYLIREEDMPVSEIAFICGFSSAAVFSRSFKNHFQCSASDFRQTNHLSKNGKAESNNGQVSTSVISYFSNVEQLKKWRLIMNNIEVKNMPELKLIYCRHVGQFDRIGKAFEKLMKWAGPRGLLQFPETKTVTVYHDDPGITDIEKLRQSACITVDREVKTDGEFGTMKVDAGKFVVGRFEISVTEFDKAWNAVCLWMTENGYQASEGYPYELYYNDHTQHPENKFILDICVPVKQL